MSARFVVMSAMFMLITVRFVLVRTWSMSIRFLLVTGARHVSQVRVGN